MQLRKAALRPSAGSGKTRRNFPLDGVALLWQRRTKMSGTQRQFFLTSAERSTCGRAKKQFPISHPVLSGFIILCAACSNGLYAQQFKVAGSEYRGFHVEYREVRNDPELARIQIAMNKQIDMVLEVGLSHTIVKSMRGVQIEVRAGKESWAGHYAGTSKSVSLTSRFLMHPGKPALLHEFLHAYHDQVLPGGFKNKQILAYFERAKELKVYDASSHMMANQKEYFASAGTAYLFGVTELEPFNRAKVQQKQPYFYKYMQSLFGPEAGKYNGTLEECKVK